MARITVEDCLEKIPSRFDLILMASKRARQLIYWINNMFRIRIVHPGEY